MEDPRSDAELLRELRDGERDAYVVLWERHIGAALRYAGRGAMTPADLPRGSDGHPHAARRPR